MGRKKNEDVLNELKKAEPMPAKKKKFQNTKSTCFEMSAE
jgi:hypothetical protein